MSDRWGGVDVLVNNAGFSKMSALMEITPEEFDDIVAIDLRGTFSGTNAGDDSGRSTPTPATQQLSRQFDARSRRLAP